MYRSKHVTDKQSLTYSFGKGPLLIFNVCQNKLRYVQLIPTCSLAFIWDAVMKAQVTQTLLS